MYHIPSTAPIALGSLLHTAQEEILCPSLFYPYLERFPPLLLRLLQRAGVPEQGPSSHREPDNLPETADKPPV